MNFATTCSRRRSQVKISDTVGFRIPRSASSSHTISHWSLLIAACTHSACYRPSWMWVTFNRFPLKCLCHTFICIALIVLFWSPRAFWIIRIVSTEECSSLMQNLRQIRCCTHSVILNATATQYTCSLNRIYHPHWLVQWSHHCSHMCIPVHSPWLSGYINVVQTILVILIMSGLFLEATNLIHEDSKFMT